MIRLLFVLTLCLPVAALADNALLQRYEAAQEQTDSNMDAMMIRKLPELQGHTPLREWDEVDRAIGQCVLDAVAKERGPAGLEAFVAAAEQFATMTFTSMNHVYVSTPPEISGKAVVDLMQTCGVFDRSYQLQTDSGMADITGNLANLERLMAE
jgi:hypothetical protein